MRTIAAHAALLSIALVLLAIVPGQAQDTSARWPDPNGWPEYGGSLRRAGVSPLAGPAQNARLLTPASLAGPSYSAPVADRQGNLYVADDTGVVTKLRGDLTKAWRTSPLGGSARSSVALGPDGTVYLGLVAGPFVALDGATGATKWTGTIDNTAVGGYVITAAPAVHPAGFVVQPSMDGWIYAFNVTGSLRWKFETDTTLAGTDIDNKVVAAPAIGSDGTIYVGSQNGYLYAFTSAGTLKWKFRTTELTAPGFQEEQQVSSPSLGADGTIYVTTRLKNSVGLGMVYAFEDKGTSVQKKWSQQLNDRVTAPVTVASDGSLYIGDVGGGFYRLNPQTGDILWDFNPVTDDAGVLEAIREGPSDSMVLSAAELAIADAAGHVYVGYWHVDLSEFPPKGSFKSPMYALKQSDLTIVWRDIFPKTARSPLLAPSDQMQGDKTAGILYWVGEDGKVYAHGVGKPLVPTAPTTAATTSSTTNTTAPSSPASSTAPPRGDGIPGPGFALAALTLFAAAAAIRFRRA